MNTTQLNSQIAGIHRARRRGVFCIFFSKKGVLLYYGIYAVTKEG
jgi:hypothetical protein